MTDRELFEKALEAMEHLNRTGDTQVFDLCYAPELIPALKERLAQPEPIIDKSAAIRIATALGWVPPGDTSQERVDQAQKQRHEQEPVAWVLEWIEDGEVYASKLYESERRCRYDAKKDTDAVCRPLVYGDTSPSKREWQGLTDEEMHECWGDPLTPLGMKCARAIEAKLKHKNT